MKILFEASENFAPIANAFAILTDMAEICVDDIQYDLAEGIVQIPLKRRRLIQQEKRRHFSLHSMRPSYDWDQTYIKAQLTIRQVKKLNKEIDPILMTECDSLFSVKMGLSIKQGTLYLGSLEETRGKTLCEIYIEVESIDLELSDQG
jgi:hypothetical protein